MFPTQNSVLVQNVIDSMQGYTRIWLIQHHTHLKWNSANFYKKFKIQLFILLKITHNMIH
jgi:hypothetical protein